MKNQWKAVVALVLAGVVTADAAVGTGRKSSQAEKPENKGGNPPPKLSVDNSPLPADIKNGSSYAPIIKRVAPSVVNIYSTLTVRGSPHPFLDDPLFRQFFGDQGPSNPSRPRKEQSLGSGVIVSADGYVLTANHVVEGADTVKVALASGDQEYDAKVIGTDPATDIAVLRIEPKKPLPAATLGDSEKLEVGDTVLAVGNPFGVGQTVTMGIVSAVGRGGLGITGYENFIQTDAAINPGNSGGALIDVQGRLMGINTAILSRSGGFMGVGFAVPISMARYVMDRLISDGKVTRGYLGINIQPLTADLAKEFRLPDESSGVMVGGVTPNSAAEKAGVKEGDVIIEVNGKKITDPRSLQLTVTQISPGTKVNLKVLRVDDAGRTSEKTVSATLGELPQEAVAFGMGRRGEGKSQPSGSDSLDGVEVADLDSRTRRQFNIPQNVQGALVANVEQDSNAAEAGLRPGDIILEIDRKPVRTADDAVAMSEKATGERILLRIWTQTGGGPGGTRFLVVDNAKKK